MTSRFFSLLLSAATIFSLGSCNNSDESTSNNTDSSNNQTSNTTNVSSTVVTTPQTMLIIRHKVSNYAKWKMAYDGHDSARLASGIHSYVIGRGLQDSNMIVVALKVDDTTKAMSFAKDPGLKTAMQKGGVIGTPDITWYTATWQDTASIATTLRSSVTFTVKDWSTWLNHFDSGKQERTDNGIMVRSYGHAGNDNNKVRVVTALIDSAKAMAYFGSDMLKKRMQDGGATSQPDRFLYRIVQLYR